ncbi:MAG TPA: response regulator transcription factor [Phycisphaerales bacterium]|nr:response regulator transcription factor [Phycisphaerales bacterium]
MKLRILLAEEHAVVREALCCMIDLRQNMQIVGHAGSGKAALELAQELRPDVVVTGVAMRNMNGIEATRLIKEKLPDTKIVALSAYDNEEYVMGMIKAGVSAYLLKNCAFEELVKAIETVVQGKSYLSPDIATIVLRKQIDNQDDAPMAVLNERDKKVVRLLAEGKSARQIAREEGLSVKTIEGRRRKIMEKLNFTNMAQLIRYAIEEGYISTPIQR